MNGGSELLEVVYMVLGSSMWNSIDGSVDLSLRIMIMHMRLILLRSYHLIPGPKSATIQSSKFAIVL